MLATLKNANKKNKDAAIDGAEASVFDKNVEKHGLDNDIAVLSETIKGSDNSILDVGCGSGKLAIGIRNKAKVLVGIDVSPAMIKLARRNFKKYGSNATFLIRDAAFTSLCSSSFTHIIFSFSLHHTRNRKAWLDEATRLLKKNGDVIIIERLSRNGCAKLFFPLYWHLRYKKTHQWKEEMPNLLSMKEINAMLKSRGLRLTRCTELASDLTARFKDALYPKYLITAVKE